MRFAFNSYELDLKSSTYPVFPLLALELIIAVVEVVKVLFKLPARRTFREVVEATALAKRIMAAAECADKLLYNTHALPLPHNVM